MAQKFTVLFVEDDAGVREVLPEILPEGEFDTLVADSGYAAMRILAQEHVDLLLADVVMAGLSGVELAKQAMLMCPNLSVLFMTGYLSRAQEAERIAPLLYKPIRPHEIERAIRDALSAQPRLH